MAKKTAKGRDYIGRTIYFPRKLHKKLQVLAKAENRCLSPFIIRLLEALIK